MFVMVGQFEALSGEASRNEYSKALQAVYIYFSVKNMVQIYDPINIPESSRFEHSGMDEYIANRRKNTCQNCGDEGHKRAECPNK